jgi:hypothetical protein
MAVSVSNENHAELLTVFSPLPDGIDGDRVNAADKILKMGNVAVCKPTRAGFTTSAVIAAERGGLKTLVVAPTRNILNKTVRAIVLKMDGTPCDIPGNVTCKYVQEFIKKDPLFEELPIMKEERCDGCEYYDGCPVTEIERVGDLTTVCITYAKLEAVMLSSSDSSKFIREQLADLDEVILDEAHLLSFPSLPQVHFEKHVVIPAQYRSLKMLHDKWRDLQDENRDNVRDIEFFTEQNPQQYTGLSVFTHYSPKWEEISKLWGELIDLAENRAVWGVTDDDILDLRDIITIMSGSTATISYISSNNFGRMVVTGSQGRDHYALKIFLTEVAPKAHVIFVSGTLVERRDGFFSEISGREIETAIFPDLNNTNSKMHLHPSKWRFSHIGKSNGIPQAIRESREIIESVGDQPIYMLAMNSRLAAELEKAFKDLPNITVDYYKSADSIGVAQEARICIAVGAAELPRHACDPLAEGNDDHERFYDSQQLRINAVDCATWQAVSRVKDPDGLAESHVHFIGVRAEVVSRIATWGTEREVSAQINSRGSLDSSVICKQYLGRPNTLMEERRDLRPGRRKVGDYVDAVVPISDIIQARQNSDTFPYTNIIGETVRFLDEPLRLYNLPNSSDEFEQNLFALTTLFVTRVDKCGLQWKQPNYKGKFGYKTAAPPKPFKDLLMDHLFDCETIALPPFDLEDNCHYCAVDFDDHDGDTPQSENVKKLTSFLKEQNMPCIVVKSGSNDGYHVFIPIVPTKTLVANKFLKQLVKDAGMDDHIERYPKQKSSSSSKSGYGSQIKLPLGFNWKAGKKSAVVDSCSLEPVEFVEVAYAVKLHDIPEPVEKKPQEPKACNSPPAATYSPGEMRPCIRAIIDSGAQLEGGEGHMMRVAIAAEALRCGLSEEQTIGLFRSQDDFDEQETIKNIRFIWDNQYKRFGCEKLQDVCGSIVKGYCEKCPLSSGEC